MSLPYTACCSVTATEMGKQKCRIKSTSSQYRTEFMAKEVSYLKKTCVSFGTRKGVRQEVHLHACKAFFNLCTLHKCH